MKYNLEKEMTLCIMGNRQLTDGHFEHHNENGSLYCEYSLKGQI